MHILSFLNVTNRNNLSTDSGYIFYNLLADYFLKNNNNFTFVAPQPLQSKKCNYIPFEFGQNKYEVRFSFEWEKIANILRETNPDIILVNQIELIPNYKAVLECIGSNALLVGYAHYIPYSFNKENKICLDTSLNNGSIWRSVLLNFLSGLLAADCVFVHSKTSLGFLKKIHKQFNFIFQRNKFKINPPPKDPFLSVKKNVLDKKLKIIYNHRLYAHYGTQFFVNLVPDLIKAFNPSIHVFDILNKRSPERKRLDDSVDQMREKLRIIRNVKLRNDGNIRSVYKKGLQGARLSFAPYRRGCTWSMACIDSMSMGIPVVAPNEAWFAEFISEDLLFNNAKEALSITEKLIKDDKFWNQKSQEAIKKTEALKPNIIANKFLQVFKKYLKNPQQAAVA